MHELIIQAFSDSPVMVENATKGAFELIAPDKSIIIPQVWEAVVKPGWIVTIRFFFPIYTATNSVPRPRASNSSAEDSEDPDLQSGYDPAGPAYDRNVKHTV